MVGRLINNIAYSWELGSDREDRSWSRGGIGSEALGMVHIGYVTLLPDFDRRDEVICELLYRTRSVISGANRNVA